MLTTLIYRSVVNPAMQHASVYKLVEDALDKNKSNHVTGILIFNGTDFFQVLEGEEVVVNTLFNRIKNDSRHNSVVLLMQDYSAYRRFQDTGMLLFDVSTRTEKSIIEDILNLSHFKGSYLQDDRIIRLTKKFLGRVGQDTISAEFNPTYWYLECKENFKISDWPIPSLEQPCQFALQPIVEALTGKISSYEALIRSPSGGTPVEIFEKIPADKLYLFDLETKFYAFELARQLLKNNEKLSINLLPGVLYSIPEAVSILIQQINDAGLRPEQIIVEVTETEAITDQDVFYQALKELRVAGIGLAIDDFGAGFSGLALLTKFQPDKIKIDRALIENIHLSGVKQAIVRSIAQCCDELGITLVAEGVELMDEWCWLESIGIHLFQGFLFSRPSRNDTGIIRWPQVL